MCKYCGLLNKRVNDHYQICYFCSLIIKNSNNIDEDFNNNNDINKSILSYKFDIKYCDDLNTINNKYFLINDSFIYFINYCIGKECYGSFFLELKLMRI